MLKSVLACFMALTLYSCATYYEEASGSQPHAVTDLSKVSRKPTQPQKIADMKVTDKVFSSESPLAVGAWLTYGTTRASFVTCNGYIYTYEEELAGREAMAKFWVERFTADTPTDKYVVTLAKVYGAGFLQEYVWHYYFQASDNKSPEGLNLTDFVNWQSNHLVGHKPETNVNVELNSSACQSI